MKLRPIIFRGDMVRAILAGTKTQTRRVLTVPWKGRTRTQPYEPYYVEEDGRLMVDCDDGYREASECLPCPCGVPGDELWVRETWGVGTRPDPHDGWRDGVEYKADCHGLDEGDDLPLHRVSVPDGVDLDALIGPWRSPRFMPRWASRLTLVVRSVRVERLSAITESDVRAEGFGSTITRDCKAGAFMDGFRAMHKLAADADPWLWVVGFERMESAR